MVIDLKQFKTIAITLMISLLLISVMPVSFPVAENTAEKNEKSSIKLQKRAEMIVKVANLVAQRIEGFIKKIQNDSIILEKLENADLIDDLEGNISAFEDARSLIDDASKRLSAKDYSGAISLVKEALMKLRNVCMAIHRMIMEVQGVREEGRTEGLIVAMKRSLMRLQRIKSLIGEEDLQLVEKAERYLNITEAKRLLAEGNVSEVSHRLVEANKIIKQLYTHLKEKASSKTKERVNRYLHIIGRFRENIINRIGIARAAGVNITEILQTFGVKNVTELREKIAERIREAKKKGDIKELLGVARKVGRGLWKIDRAITIQMMKHIHMEHPHKHLGKEHNMPGKSNKKS